MSMRIWYSLNYEDSAHTHLYAPCVEGVRVTSMFLLISVRSDLSVLVKLCHQTH